MKRLLLKIVFAVSAIAFLLVVPYIGAIHFYGLSSDWNVEWLAALVWTLPAARIVILSALPVALASGMYLHFSRPKEESGKPSFVMQVIGFLTTLYVQLLLFGLLVGIIGGKANFGDRLPLYAVLFALIVASGPAIRGYLIWRNLRSKPGSQPDGAQTSTTEKEKHP